MAEHRPGAARKHGAELAGAFGRRQGMAKQVHAVEKPVKARRSQAVIDRVVGQSGVTELGAGDDAALPPRKVGDRPFTVCPHAVNPDLGARPRTIAGFTAHIAVNPDFGRVSSFAAA